MKENRQQKKIKIRIKILLILEAVICYMAFLNVISHIQGPPQYQVLTDAPLLTTSDFLNFDGKKMAGDTLAFSSQNEGTAVGYQTQLSLSELESICVSFTLNCPADYVGTMLYIDLYNGQAQYDNPEQEHQIVLQSGLNMVESVFSIEEDAPSEAQLRVFTLEKAGYTVDKLQVCKAEPLPKVTGVMVAALAIGMVVLVATVIVYYRYSVAENNSLKEENHI